MLIVWDKNFPWTVELKVMDTLCIIFSFLTVLGTYFKENYTYRRDCFDQSSQTMLNLRGFGQKYLWLCTSVSYKSSAAGIKTNWIIRSHKCRLQFLLFLDSSLNLTSGVQHQPEIQAKVEIFYQSIPNIRSQTCKSHLRSWVLKYRQW